MIDNAESYLDEGVSTGILKPSRDPAARAKYLAITGGGGFLLYIQMHETPTDLRAVLRDYAQRHGAACPRALHRRPDDRQPHVRRLSRPSRTRRI
jgi:hypothetical protein